MLSLLWIAIISTEFEEKVSARYLKLEVRLKVREGEWIGPVIEDSPQLKNMYMGFYLIHFLNSFGISDIPCSRMCFSVQIFIGFHYHGNYFSVWYYFFTAVLFALELGYWLQGKAFFYDRDSSHQRQFSKVWCVRPHREEWAPVMKIKNLNLQVDRFGQ